MLFKLITAKTRLIQRFKISCLKMLLWTQVRRIWKGLSKARMSKSSERVCLVTRGKISHRIKMWLWQRLRTRSPTSACHSAAAAIFWPAHPKSAFLSTRLNLLQSTQIHNRTYRNTIDLTRTFLHKLFKFDPNTCANMTRNQIHGHSSWNCHSITASLQELITTCLWLEDPETHRANLWSMI